MQRVRVPVEVELYNLTFYVLHGYTYLSFKMVGGIVDTPRNLLRVRNAVTALFNDDQITFGNLTHTEDSYTLPVEQVNVIIADLGYPVRNIE
jgi:hypothetical protein